MTRTQYLLETSRDSERLPISEWKAMQYLAENKAFQVLAAHSMVVLRLS